MRHSGGSGAWITGFTLIELMIAVAIIAILASIALPAYQEQIRKSRRAQAKADLVEYAQLAERYFTVNNTYVGFTLPTSQSPREAGATARYNLPAPTTTATTFTLTANATGAQASDRCGDLSITNTGQKGETGSASLEECW
ncbi:MAG: prepilin-type N-terminal cleavage/methylation domain-containing protein [Xanthomonadales bacterium]|nr:prepilin-type N-terminal cleavage/methylation domain-containing protein [Xanthomonadales bacterium]MCA0196662.1 prepilin-type N-terminal cleavage/methylation domain-containing protein [Pseudomonadota bacterium]HRF83007.1 type IV pilin protein [Pseudoxanthomonas sp.]